MGVLSFFRRTWTGRGHVPAAPATPPATPPPLPPSGAAFWPMAIREPYTGAWQRNDSQPACNMLANATVFACVTLIASDIAKLAPLLLHDKGDDLWRPTKNAAFTPVLHTPNQYQNHIQFKESWLISKLTHGNTFTLKQRDQRGVVNAMYVLDPRAVTPLVAPDGEVFYQLRNNNLAGLNGVYFPPTIEGIEGIDGAWVVPASEMMHDRFNCLYHPLIGLSPLYAAALPALAGLTIGQNANNFWGNAARPSGILTAPGAIGDDTAKRLKTYWQDNFTGTNSGRVAVLGDGLKFEPMTMSALDAQLVEQLKWGASTICSVFHVPAFKVGVGDIPSHQNVETLNQIYYTDCIQAFVEAWELAVTDGLSLPSDYQVALDIDALLRMDTASRYATYGDAIKSGWLSPNEARSREDLPPVDGGETPYLQQQNYSLGALARRDRASPAPASVAPASMPGTTP